MCVLQFIILHYRVFDLHFLWHFFLFQQFLSFFPHSAQKYLLVDKQKLNVDIIFISDFVWKYS